MTEFTQIQGRLAPLAEALAALDSAAAGAVLDAAAVSDWLSRAADTEREVRHVADRLLTVFRARALETDPGKVVYGAAMRERVLLACRQAEALVERFDAVLAARAYMQGVADALSKADAAAAAEADRSQRAHEKMAAAAREAAAAEERAREQRDAQTRAHEQAAAAKAAAARVLASAAPALPPVAPADTDGAIAAARAAYAGVALDIEQALERVRLACTLPAYADVVQVACLLLSNIQKYPEERGFRSLRLRNQLVHTRVAVHEGGLALLRALGFALGDVEADEPLLLLEEPDVQRQFEEWAGWFERLKANIARLEAELRTLRVAPLPTAVKGAQQLEPTRGRRQGPQVATLHGSSGRSM
ncbi:hypothetical protein KFE25_006107 [Diacronema lutheri]|uniref:PUB domain-containing protein n=1 Tax=Diacronema lutheri TaxID=2081491 RepID=A0A8J5XW90_DIALT|nr:hypothetical protein KFE25_006107 [Diacronema lutheri]